MMMSGSGQQLTVPPGFRFHPTEEELLYYYLRKKVSYEPIDLDVIREVDLNKLEPWDLKEKCRIGSGPQNDWYFFSHKDKKYPTGTRTNRATTAGFWKATGRDKAIHMSNSKRIGMRKTLVFYTGRAPRGQKTDWIMHEYRLEDEQPEYQEEGWVVCRVFKKKNHTRNFQTEIDQDEPNNITIPLNPNIASDHYANNNHYPLDHHNSNSLHLPQLMSPESTVHNSFLSSLPLMDSQNLLRLTSNGAGSSAVGLMVQPEKFSGDWSFLDKLLATHQTTMDQNQINKCQQFSHVAELVPTAHRFPFNYHGYEPDFSKYSK
ncbi:hypothetical protein RD792_002651 [Penstemon davidsonii]|uniref:NAC domain-containing protein n=1 Tax=Penstemon davidsonii TaxID=160366 RepID=A0ABR0DSB8_9LAMI|nr:hypothetical protein RD792_002651 [Penstemon davidsonii]